MKWCVCIINVPFDNLPFVGYPIFVFFASPCPSSSLSSSNILLCLMIAPSSSSSLFSSFSFPLCIFIVVICLLMRLLACFLCSLACLAYCYLHHRCACHNLRPPLGMPSLSFVFLLISPLSSWHYCALYLYDAALPWSLAWFGYLCALPPICICCVYTVCLFRDKERGWKTQGRGKHTIKTPPKNGFGPHTHDTFPLPPPFAHAMSFALEDTGTDQTNPTFWGLQKWLTNLKRFLEYGLLAVRIADISDAGGMVPCIDVIIIRSFPVVFRTWSGDGGPACLKHAEMIATVGQKDSTHPGSKLHSSVWLRRWKPKGDGGKGTGKKASRQLAKKHHDYLRHFTTICDMLWQFMSLCTPNVIKRHKTS